MFEVMTNFEYRQTQLETFKKERTRKADIGLEIQKVKLEPETQEIMQSLKGTSHYVDEQPVELKHSHSVQIQLKNVPKKSQFFEEHVRDENQLVDE